MDLYYNWMVSPNKFLNLGIPFSERIKLIGLEAEIQTLGANALYALSESITVRLIELDDMKRCDAESIIKLAGVKIPARPPAGERGPVHHRLAKVEETIERIKDALA